VSSGVDKLGFTMQRLSSLILLVNGEYVCRIQTSKIMKDGALLDKAEVEFSCNAIHDLLTNPVLGNYDFIHLCQFHARIFGDVYDWAGSPC